MAKFFFRLNNHNDKFIINAFDRIRKNEYPPSNGLINEALLMGMPNEMGIDNQNAESGDFFTECGNFSSAFYIFQL